MEGALLGCMSGFKCLSIWEEDPWARWCGVDRERGFGRLELESRDRGYHSCGVGFVTENRCRHSIRRISLWCSTV